MTRVRIFWGYESAAWRSYRMGLPTTKRDKLEQRKRDYARGTGRIGRRRRARFPKHWGGR